MTRARPASCTWRRLALTVVAAALALVTPGALARAEVDARPGVQAVTPSPAPAHAVAPAQSPVRGAEPHADAATGPGAWAVIVHPSSPVRRLNAGELERIYRRRTRFWPNGDAILPLNLPSSDPLRSSFTEAILHDSEEALATFWNREYFQGTGPPVVLRSSRAVRAYVAKTPTAIGYVHRSDLDASVTEVEIVDAD